MPRVNPFQCHSCGTLYTGGRCPKCYPKRGRKSGGHRSGGGGGRRTARHLAAQVLGHSWLPVNPDAVPSAEDDGDGDAD
ncbi:MAG: hypothetical protein JXA21_01715 [Anaerolineae bacterium]|nr:hypothetical protein [Anaerolineae bacterium]